MELPELNKRLNELVDYFCGGNKKAFSSLLNGISQQKFNRLFIPDPRTGKIPTVPGDVITQIILTYQNINSEWLLVGKGDMLKENISENSANLSKQTISKDRNNIDEVITNKINDIIMENIPTIITATIDGIAKVILPQIEGNQKTIEKQLDMLSEAMKMLVDINRKSDDIRENVVKLTRKTG